MVKFIQNNWLLIAILILAIYLVWKYWDKITNAVNDTPSDTGSGSGTGAGSNSGSGSNTGTGTGSGNNTGSGSNTGTVKTSNYSFGDNIYAKENAVNIYKTALISASNLAKYSSYSKDSLIGTYLSTEGAFTKVLIQNPASSVFVLSNQIYSK